MPFDRVQGEEKPLAYLTIRETLGNKVQDFQLARTECSTKDETIGDKG